MDVKKLLMFLTLAFVLTACADGPVDNDPVYYKVTVLGGTADREKALEGEEVTLTPTIPDGYTFKTWKVLEGGVEVVDNKFTMLAADVKVQAEFNEPATYYTVTVTGGTADREKALEGEEVTLTPKIPSGHKFNSWKVLEGAVDIVDNKFTMPAGNVEVEALFDKIYAVTVTDGTANPTNGIEGDEITLTPNVPAGYEFMQWRVQIGDIEIKDNKFTMPADRVNVRAVFRLIVKPSYLLYWDGEALAVGHWGEEVSQENILFTKFGSLAAFTTVSNNDVWDAGDVKFTTTGATYDDYATIPYHDGPEDIDGFITSPEYHNDANLASDKGDICRLVGLTPAEAAELAAAGTLDEAGNLGSYEDQGMRLSTRAEFLDFAAVPASSFYGLFSNSNLAFWGAAPAGGNGNGAWFPVPGDRTVATGRTVQNDDPRGFLPAAGLRNAVGEPRYVGTDGNYWSSRARVNSGDIVTFSADGLRIPVGGAKGFGYAVRCVPMAQER